MKKSVKTKIVSMFLLLCLVMVSCSSSAAMNEDADVSSTTDVAVVGTLAGGSYGAFIEGWISDDEAKATVVPDGGQMPATYDPNDFAFDEAGFEEVSINLLELEGSYANGDVSVAKGQTVVEITVGSAVGYNIELTGSVDVGVRIVSDGAFVLTLDSVSIRSMDSSKQAALEIDGAECFIVLVGESTIEGCTSKKGNAIESSDSIVFSGEGVLNVVGNTKHGIVSGDVVCIQSGVLNVVLNPETSSGTGIKPVNGYVQNGGTVRISALNMTVGSETKGIKVDGDENETEYGAGKGYILINGGELTIDSSGKGMTAGFDPTEDGDTTSSIHDPYADVFVNNGLITITTYATPREDTYTNGASNDDGVSPEGIEGKRSVTINGGKIVLNTTDDCINASVDGSASIVFNGGLIYAYSSNADSIDSNGTIVLNGGILIALGSSVPECGIDCDSDSRFTYTGGTLIAMGGGNQLPSSPSTTGFVLSNGSGMTMGGGMRPFMAEDPRSWTGGGRGFDAFQGGGDGGVPHRDPSNGDPSNGGPSNGGQSSLPPEIPSGDMAHSKAPDSNGFEKSGDAAFGEASGRTTLGEDAVVAVVDADGNPLVVFDVPDGCITDNVLIASDCFEKGAVFGYTGSASIVNADNMFAGSLALGSVTIAVPDMACVAIGDYVTAIEL